MSSTKKIQLALVASVALLMIFLFVQPIKGLVNPPKEKQTEKKAAAFSLTSEVQKAKKQLTQTALNEVEQLEEENQSNTPKSLEALAQKWNGLGYGAIGGFYLQQKASVTNTPADWMQAGEMFKTTLKGISDTVIAAAVVQSAIECYEKVLATDAKNVQARTGMAACYVEGTSNPMQGIQLLLQIVEEEPDNYQANLSLGLFSMKSGQFDKAIKRFEKVVKIQPDAESYFYLAEAYKNTGETQKAIIAYETCAKLLPDASSRKSIEAYISELKKNN